MREPQFHYTSLMLEGLQPEARKHLRRNFALGVANGAIFSFGDALQDINLVLSVFVNRLSGSNLLVGLLLPIRLGGWALPQLLFSCRVQAAPRKLPYYRLAAAVRLAAEMGLAVAVFLVGNKSLLLAVMFLLILGQTLSGGLSGLAFADVVAKTIPSRMRGSFLAWRGFIGGILALLGALVVRYFLDERRGLAFPTNYAVLFVLATVALAGSFTSFASVKEPREDNVQARAGVMEQLGRAAALARAHRDFRTFLVSRALLMVAEIASPFYILYAKLMLGLPDSIAGTYLTVSTVANILSTYLWGRLSDRTGNRTLLRLVCAISCLPPLLALGAWPAIRTMSGAGWLPPAFFGLIFALIGASRTGIFIGGLNFLLDLAPADDRSIYVGLTNTVVGVASFASALGGVVVEVLGYRALFSLTFVLYVAATAAVMRTSEPREAARAQERELAANVP